MQPKRRKTSNWRVAVEIINCGDPAVNMMGGSGLEIFCTGSGRSEMDKKKNNAGKDYNTFIIKGPLRK